MLREQIWMYKLCATSARFGTAASEQSGSERDAAFEKGIGESGPLLTQTPTAQPGAATIRDTQHFKTLTLDAHPTLATQHATSSFRPTPFAKGGPWHDHTNGGNNGFTRRVSKLYKDGHDDISAYEKL